MSRYIGTIYLFTLVTYYLKPSCISSRLDYLDAYVQNCAPIQYQHKKYYIAFFIGLQAPHQSTYVLLLPPLLFSLAHIHKTCIAMFTRTTPPLHLLATASLQLLYTFVFGTYASLCTLVSGSIYPALLMHIFCNAWGLPDLASVS